MYRDTSRDLVRLAGVHGGQVVVDLACGTGVTAEELLAALGPDGVPMARPAPSRPVIASWGSTRWLPCPGPRSFHAVTRAEGETVVTAGGRVLGVTAWGDDLAEARAAAYRAVGSSALPTNTTGATSPRRDFGPLEPLGSGSSRGRRVLMSICSRNRDKIDMRIWWSATFQGTPSNTDASVMSPSPRAFSHEVALCRGALAPRPRSSCWSASGTADLED